MTNGSRSGIGLYLHADGLRPERVAPFRSKSWEDSLPPELFLRAHRAALVNRMHVTGYKQETPRKILLKVSGVPQGVSASRQATPLLKARLLAPLPPASASGTHAN